MPDMDKTGPLGTGPFGRGMGPCGNGQAGRGRGGQFRRGGGLGWGRMPARLSAEEAKVILEQHKSRLEAALAAVTGQLQDMEKNLKE